jgi:xanthine dehydrogenase YagR molybdenum-binding subunit
MAHTSKTAEEKRAIVTGAAVGAPMNREGRAVVGAPMNRIDGRLKVTGAARYSAEMPVANVHYAVIVQSTVASGRIRSIDTAEAEKMTGVVKVLTHLNAPRLPTTKVQGGRELTLLQDDKVRYNGQPIALVVADTLERATDAALRVRATYAAETPATSMQANKGSAYAQPGRGGVDSKKGDATAGLASADVRVEHTYATPIENHNPMEPHSTIAVWEGDKLTVYDATQYVTGDRDTVAKTIGVPPENVRLVSYFIGGAFGCKGSVWSHVPLAAMAARDVGLPVKLVLSRRQMYGPVGARPQTEQKIALGAKRDGTLTGIRHDSVSHTSRFEDFLEPSAMQTRMLYACPNIETTHRLVKLDLGTPTYQRAPGESTGTFALESAMDELAVALNMDPLELRLKNYAEVDPESGKPWSSKSLRECYRVASERFGWAKRNASPGAMRDGNVAIGYGMATATYPTNRQKASASVKLAADSAGTVRALVQSATQDIGTGTYTVMTQIAADALALPVERVRVEIGDSRFPPSPVSGGSMTSASTGSAIHEVCRQAREQLAAQGVTDDASLAAFIQRQPDRSFTVRADSAPGDERQKYSMHSFGAVFAEVRVDRELGEIRVARIVSAYGAGRILNAKTAHSQLVGGVVWGVGMALEEETLVDARTGRYMNADLAEYHVPVNADIGQLDVSFVEEDDAHVNPIGVKGIGEIGITGVAAAIANAVYNATGVRVRELPITLDKVMGGTRV